MREEIIRPVVPWEVRESGLAFDHPWARVRRDVCITAPGAEPIEYFSFEGPDFAIVFAVTDAGDVLLTRQYKHGIGEIVYELPAGMIDSDDASSNAAARRELLEETGHARGDWTPLGVLYASPSKSTVRAHAFLARGVVRVAEPSPDANEAIAVVTVSLNELRLLLHQCEIKDTTSVAICYAALAAIAAAAPAG